MHELSVATELVAMVKIEARKNGLTRINTVRVGLAPLSAVHEATLTEVFNVLSVDQGLEGAELEFVHLPVKISCSSCRSLSELDAGPEGFREIYHNPLGKPLPRVCLKCGSENIRLVDASAMILLAIVGERGNAGASG